MSVYERRSKCFLLQDGVFKCSWNVFFQCKSLLTSKIVRSKHINHTFMMDSWSWCSVSQCSDQGPTPTGPRKKPLPVTSAPHSSRVSTVLTSDAIDYFACFEFHADGIIRYECSCLPPSNTSVLLCVVCWFSLRSMPVVWILHSAFLHSTRWMFRSYPVWGSIVFIYRKANILKHSLVVVYMNFLSHISGTVK